MIFRRDVKHRIAKKLLENVPNNHFLPYPYQLDLLDTAYERNTIICLSNELTKSFITLSLIREMGYDHLGKRALYITQEKNILETAHCLARHTGLSVVHFQHKQPFIGWRFCDWTNELSRHHVTVMSPWLIPCVLSDTSPDEFQVFLLENFYLLAVSECHHVLDPAHPYFQLFGPRGLDHFSALVDQNGLSDCTLKTEKKTLRSFQRIVCFTSSLLPREITDPSEAEARIVELEKRTNCRLETASELLTMLSLGARPKERVLLSPAVQSSGNCAIHHFFTRILSETREFLTDILPGTLEFTCDRNTCEQTVTTSSGSPYLSNTQVPDSRGRMICVLDYCRRAVLQCEEVLLELGVWCAGQIARVFVKHLIGLDRRRALLVRTRTSSGDKLNSSQSMEHGEDQLARVLRFTVTQLCMLVRLFQIEFDTCLTLETFKTMISPKILTLVEQLKAYKPNMNFRIEVAELPSSFNLASGSRRARRRRRSLQGSASESGSTALVRVNLLSGDPSGSSDSSADTMSSVSDGEDTDSRMNSSSRKSSASRKSFRARGSKPKSKSRSSSSVLPKTRDLNFVPTSALVDGRLRPDADPSQLVYRAVLDPEENGKPPTNPPRLCGLVLVGCQFTAYALSRLIDELCVWDVDLFFVKPGHLFSRPTSTSDSEQNSHSAAHQTALKTGDESVAAPHGCEQSTLPATQEETISKFRRGSINLLIATQPAVSAAAGGAELPRCNLVVALQPPRSLAEYLSSKARSRLVDHGAQVVYLVESDQSGNLGETDSVSPDDFDGDLSHTEQKGGGSTGILARFQKLEQLLVRNCRSYDLFADEHDVDPFVADQLIPPIMPRGPNGPKLLLSKAINVINQYCARLPSDYITNLTPRWRLKSIPQPQTWKPPVQGPGASCGARGEVEAVRRRGLFQCLLRLPINTSVKMEIAGEPMACKKLAKLSAALNAVRALHAAGELDSRWEPSSKESSVSGSNRDNSTSWNSVKLTASFTSMPSIANSEAEMEMNDLLATCNTEPDEPSAALEVAGRRRQYYFRKFADQMRNCLPQAGDPSPNYLYFIDMRLASALPEYHNVRGRPCFRPEDEPLGFGLLTKKPLHHIPSFPIFSRSGEETVRLLELWSPLESSVTSDAQPLFPRLGQPLTEEQLGQSFKFHRIVFQAVLRLERDAVIEFNVARAYTQVIVVPIRIDTFNIDWDFISLVLSSYNPEGVCRILPRRDLSKTAISTTPVSQTGKSISPRGGMSRPSGRTRSSLRARQLGNTSTVNLLFNQPGVFDFRDEDYVNAVVMPGYRNLDQPQHYYVAEIRHDLSPLSPFPSSSYPNFAAYYTNKYEATITSMEQPLLDVDFTVLRLNLLVPRYMNIRGHCLPCSKEGRKRDRRDNLTYKQILIPELCFIHPFPASVWRKAVCLPSVLYRIHSLLLAEELRRRIAYETGLGRARLPRPRSINSKGWYDHSSDLDRHSQDSGFQLFEPLKLVFPLQVESADSRDPTASGTERGQNVVAKRRRRRDRHIRGVKEDMFRAAPSGEGRDSPEADGTQLNNATQMSKDRATDEDAGDTEDDDNQEMAVDEEDEEEEETYEHPRSKKTSRSRHSMKPPKFVKLHASSAVSPCQATSAGAAVGLPHLGLDMLLEETKVIELEDTGKNIFWLLIPPRLATLTLLNEFICFLFTLLVDNFTNMDKEYLETGSDVESVDSFEGNVRFFPSEDDCEVDNQDEEEISGVFSTLLSFPLQQSLNNDQHRVTHHNERVYRPGPANVLQALTMSCSNDFINLERMETIGDSFLKFVATVHLYLTYPNAHEGKLSHMRSRVVCNSNLYRLGRAKNLQDRMIACKFGPYENWVPPGYVVRHDPRLVTKTDHNSLQSPTRQSNKEVNLNIWSTDTLMDDEVLLGMKVYTEEIKPIDNFAVSQWDPNSPEVVKTQKSVDHCLVTIQQAIPDKSIADCVEALIGCYLTARGERSALRLMRWFGIDCLPGPDVHLRPRGAPWAVPPPLIPLNDPRRAQLEEARLSWRFDELEAKLNYKFRDPTLLIQDIEIRQLEPVDPLTEDQYDQSEKTQAQSTDASDKPDVEDEEIDTLDATLLNAAKEQESRWQQNEAEKLLGNFAPNLFVRQADYNGPSPNKLDGTKRYTACIPKSPVRQLLELEPEGTKFERPRRTADGRISVCAHVLGKGRFYGIGRNYRLAKSLAAKRALRVLRKLYASQSVAADPCSGGDTPA
ncbi:RNase3 domain protein [Opisthorchis viverrini]|uniref:RNase3 domain protein n=1 Tax=Opisthorchis viverrini TaxID=6198 RepID=A0A1S8X397_OPIVI|nr:RNase3 domain protein [Opisthorchis viverrini]